MKRFAALYEQLDGTRATSRKLTLMRDCFKSDTSFRRLKTSDVLIAIPGIQ